MRPFKQNLILYSSLAAVGCLTALGVYSKVWEHKQPVEERKSTIVTSVKPYSHRSELGGIYSGNKITICGYPDIEIDFSSDNWNRNVQVGDLVDLKFKRKFPLFSNGLEGLSISEDN